MSRKQRELDREMRNCKRKETQLKIAQDSLESTQHLFNNAKVAKSAAIKSRDPEDYRRARNLLAIMNDKEFYN